MASISAGAALAGTMIRARTLPWTCTAISTSLSVSIAGSNAGHGSPAMPPATPSRSPSSSARCGANGHRMHANRRSWSRVMPPFVGSAMSLGRVAAFTSSIIAAMAVLKLSRSMSSPTFAMVRWSCFSTFSSAAAAQSSAPVRSSTARRHARCRKRNTPTMSRVFHGFDASSGPMYIS